MTKQNPHIGHIGKYSYSYDIPMDSRYINRHDLHGETTNYYDAPSDSHEWSDDIEDNYCCYSFCKYIDDLVLCILKSISFL